MKLKIKDVTDRYTTESLRPHHPWVFHRVLEHIEIDFIADDDHEAEANHIDYFEKYDERLKNEIPNWNELKALKKSLQG